MPRTPFSLVRTTWKDTWKENRPIERARRVNSRKSCLHGKTMSDLGVCYVSRSRSLRKRENISRPASMSPTNFRHTLNGRGPLLSGANDSNTRRKNTQGTGTEWICMYTMYPPPPPNHRFDSIHKQTTGNECHLRDTRNRHYTSSTATVYAARLAQRRWTELNEAAGFRYLGAAAPPKKESARIKTSIYRNKSAERVPNFYVKDHQGDNERFLPPENKIYFTSTVDDRCTARGRSTTR